MVEGWLCVCVCVCLCVNLCLSRHFQVRYIKYIRGFQTRVFKQINLNLKVSHVTMGKEDTLSTTFPDNIWRSV